MSLTITIPGAVNVTTGAMAPAVLTVGVGVPGAAGPQGPAGPGVPAGGTAGQYLQKIDGTNYNTDWVTVNLGAYAVKANNLSDLADAGTARTNLGLGTMAVATAADYSTTTVANGLYYPLSGNPSSFLTAAALSPYLTSATAASTYAVIAAGQPTAGTTGQVLTKNSGTNYDSSWATLIPGDRYLTTSTTSNTVSNGNKTFTIGTGLSYTPTQNITISYDASNHMHGEVLTYNSGTGVLTVDVNHHTGSGTYTAWVVNVGGVTPATSVAWGAITGTLSSQTDLQSALDLKLAATTAATTYYPLVGNPSSFLVAADITGKANLASPSFTGNVSITSSTGAALFIEQTGTGNILTLHDQATDTTFVTIDANGKVSTIASEATNGAGFNIAHGVAPTTPVNGDIWTTTSGLFARINGGTQQYAPLGSNNIFSNSSSTYGSSTATGTINVASGAAISGSTKTVNVGTGGVVGSTTNITVGPVLGASTTSIGNTTAASTLNLATGATLTATTKAINIGTNGVSGSTTNITLGSATSGATNSITVNGPLNVIGPNLTLGSSTAVSTINLGSGATVSGSTKTVNIGTGGLASSTTTIIVGSTNGTTTTLQGTTNGVTAAADTNSVALATTAYVVGQAGSATPLVNGTAAVGTSLRYARQDHVHGTDTTRAPLASPTFTGTPTLPTGTIATTQTAGNNTTAVATTAFVTAAVPAFGAQADINDPVSTTKAASIDNVRELLLSPGYQMFYQGVGVNGTSGAGAATNANSGRWKEYVSPNAGVAGHAKGVYDTNAASIGFAGYQRGTNLTSRNWSKKIWMSGRSMIGHYSLTSYNGSANTFARISLGGYTAIGAGDMSASIRGIGWRLQGGGSSALELQVSNGSTVTTVTSSFTPVLKECFDWEIYSDGAGNVTLFVNDSQVATTTAGPTGTQTSGLYMEGMDTTVSSTAPFIMNNLGTKIFVAI